MELLGTIKHNDDSIDSRVKLFAGDDGLVWAREEGGEVYQTDTPIENVGSAWGGDAWDLELTQ